MTKRIRVTKTVDNFSELGEKHPNEINKGSVYEGSFFSDITIGEVLFISQDNGRVFRTSTIIEINKEDCTFKTLNSTYKYEYLD